VGACCEKQIDGFTALGYCRTREIQRNYKAVNA